MKPWAPARWLSWLLKDSAVYGGAAALNKALALITFPILTRAFSVSEYGVMDLFNVVANVLAIALVWGQDSAVVRQLADETDAAARRDIVSTSLLMQAALTAAVTAMLLAAASRLGPTLNSHADAGTLLVLVALQLPLLVASAFCQGLLRWSFRRRAYLWVTVAPAVVTALGIWLLAQFVPISLVGLFSFTLAVRAAAAGLGLWFCRDVIGRPANLAHARGLLRLAAPLGLIAVLGALVPLAERLAVTRWIGEQQLGLYAVGATVATLLALPIQAVQTAWGPFSLAVHRQDDAAAIFGTVARLTTIALCAACLLLAGMAEPLIRLLASEKFVPAWQVVFPLAFALTIQAIGWILEVGLFFAKRNELALAAYAAYLLGTFAAMAVLAPRYGMLGIAWAVVAGQCTRTLVAAWLANRVHPIAWPLRAIAFIIGLTGLASLAALSGMRLPGLPWAGASSLVAAVLLAVGAWKFAFSTDERADIRAMLRGGAPGAPSVR